MYTKKNNSKKTGKEETMENKNYSYNYKYEYMQTMNKFIMNYNNFNFSNLFGPSYKSVTSEPFNYLKYQDVVSLIDNMSESDKEVLNKTIRQCYKEFYRAIENNVFPLLTDELVKLEEFKALKDIED